MNADAAVNVMMLRLSLSLRKVAILVQSYVALFAPLSPIALSLFPVSAFGTIHQIDGSGISEIFPNLGARKMCHLNNLPIITEMDA